MGMGFFEMVFAILNLSFIMTVFQYLIHNKSLKDTRELVVFYFVLFSATTIFNSVVTVTDNFLPRFLYSFFVFSSCNKFIFGNRWIQSIYNAFLLFATGVVAEMIVIVIFIFFSISIEDTQNNLVLNLISNQGMLISGSIILLSIRRIINKSSKLLNSRIIMINIILVSGGLLIGGSSLGSYLYHLPLSITGVSFALFLIAVMAAYLGLLITLVVLVNRNEINKLHLSKIESEVQYDELTRAYTRQYGLQKLKDLVAVILEETESISICFIDINNLKHVNDSYGHIEGDRMLSNICETIKRNLRNSDYIIRYGGDEFIVVFQKLDDNEIKSIMTRVLDELKQMDSIYDISFAFGIKTINYESEKTLEDHILEADSRMYEKKRLMKA